jgi:hypothetical protein
LTQAAQAASHIKNIYLSAQFHRLAGRRRKKKAIVVVAHSIVVIAYHLIQCKEPCRCLGRNYFDQRNPEAVSIRMVKGLEKLGYQVRFRH